MRTHHWRPRFIAQLSRLLAVVVLAIMLSGCQLAKSAFQDEAATVSANFAAAATTLRYLHEGKLTRQYARATFFSYASLTRGADKPLQNAAGAPDPPARARLLALYGPAAEAIKHPCLERACDWRKQVADLEKASGAFRQAAQA
jgi:hypothetical protein